MDVEALRAAMRVEKPYSIVYSDHQGMIYKIGPFLSMDDAVAGYTKALNENEFDKHQQVYILTPDHRLIDMQ